MVDLFPEIRGARLSADRRFRYALWRIWNPALPLLMVVGTNPADADEDLDDATIRLLRRYAQRLGFGGLLMGNVFGFRTPSPAVMKKAVDPVGPLNDRWLRYMAKRAGLVIAAWGKDGAHLGRAAVVQAMLGPLHCIATNRDGSPHHPLRVTLPVRPIPFPPTPTTPPTEGEGGHDAGT